MSRVFKAVCGSLAQSITFHLNGSLYNYQTLCHQVAIGFQIEQAHFTITYHDDEGDACTIGSDEELEEASRVAEVPDHDSHDGGTVTAIQVHWEPPDSDTPLPSSAPSSAVPSSSTLPLPSSPVTPSSSYNAGIASSLTASGGAPLTPTTNNEGTKRLAAAIAALPPLPRVVTPPSYVSSSSSFQSTYSPSAVAAAIAGMTLPDASSIIAAAASTPTPVAIPVVIPGVTVTPVEPPPSSAVAVASSIALPSATILSRSISPNVAAVLAGDVTCPICGRQLSGRDLNRHLDACLLGNGASVPPLERETKGPSSSPSLVMFESKEDKRATIDHVASAIVATPIPVAVVATPAKVAIAAYAPSAPPPEAPSVEPGMLSASEQQMNREAQFGLVLKRSGSNGEGRDKKVDDYRAAKLIDSIVRDIRVAALHAGGDDSKINQESLKTMLHESLLAILLEQQLDRETCLQFERRSHEDTLTFFQMADMTRRHRSRLDRDDELSRIRIEEMQRAEDDLAAVRRRTNQEADEFSTQRIAQELKMAEERKKIKEVQDKAKHEIKGKYLPGEEGALNSNRYAKFELFAMSRAFGDLAEYHYRYAESQFLRLTQGQAFRVTKVDYVVNPPLVFAFEEKQKEFLRRGLPSESTLCFHGTADKNVDLILRNNFDVSKLGSHTGNRGAFGAGIYFSEYSSTSIAYNRTGGAAARMLLSKVLMGRIFQCRTGMLGAPLTRGYDCHVAPGGQEVVIYDNRQILPCYVVHYEAAPVVAPPRSYDARGFMR